MRTARLTTSERPEGTKRTRSRRAPAAPRGNGTTTLAAAPRRREPRALRPPTMRLDSARAGRLLRQRRQLWQRREDDLALEDDAELAAWVLEDAPEGSLVRRLGVLAARDQLRDGCPDLGRRPWVEPVLDSCDDGAGLQRRT